MSELKVTISREVLGKEFNLYGDIENPLFLARHIAEWIEYDLDKVNEMMAMVDESEKLTQTISWSGQGRKMWFVTEDGLYEILMQSRKPIAKEFKKKVKELLKEIRKHGVYATPQKLEEMLNDPDTMIKTLQALKTEREKRAELEQKVTQDRPKVLFAEAVESSKSCILVGDLAKLLKQNGYDIGQNRLFEWLRNNGYLMKSGSSKNMPTQRSMDMGLFEVKESAIINSDGSVRITRTVKVTGRGQTYFVNIFLGDDEE